MRFGANLSATAESKQRSATLLRHGAAHHFCRLSVIGLFAGASIAAQAQPFSNVSIEVTSQTVSDGFSLSNAKSLPNAVVEFQARVQNAGQLWLTPDSLAITNPVPTGMSFYVGDLAGPGTGPVGFSEGPQPSQLQCAFGGFADGTDCLEFSADGGVNFAYQPQPDGDGCDTAITHIRIRPKGSMAPAHLQPSSFVLRYRMKVK